MCTLISDVKCTYMYIKNEPAHELLVLRANHSGKSATNRESFHGSGVCKEHYA